MSESEEEVMSVSEEEEEAPPPIWEDDQSFPLGFGAAPSPQASTETRTHHYTFI